MLFSLFWLKLEYRYHTDIWKLYKKLVRDTGINGLFNIEKFNKLEFGKLWREHNLYPEVSELKDLLREF